MRYFPIVSILCTFALTPAAAVEIKDTPTAASSPKDSDVDFCKQHCPDSCYIVCGGAPQCGPPSKTADNLKQQSICGGSGYLMNDNKLFELRSLQ